MATADAPLIDTGDIDGLVAVALPAEHAWAERLGERLRRFHSSRRMRRLFLRLWTYKPVPLCYGGRLP